MRRQRMWKPTRPMATRERISITNPGTVITMTAAAGITMIDATTTGAAMALPCHRRCSYTAMSGAASVCRASPACPDWLVLASGRNENGLDAQLLELGLRNFRFMPGPERANLNPRFQR